MGRGFNFSPELGHSIFDPSLQTICESLKNNPSFLGVSNIKEFTIKSNDKNISASSFDKITASKFKTPLKCGKWFTDASVKADRVPCVIVDTSILANKYNIGDVIKGSCSSDDAITGSSFTSYKTVEFEVTGIVDRNNAFIIRPDKVVSNSIQPLGDIFPSMYPDAIELLCGQLDSSQIIQNQPEKGIIYFDEGLDENKISEIMIELRKSGYTTKLSDMSRATIENLTYKLKTDIPMFFSLLSISFIGIISVALLNSKKQMKTFSIYYLFGCRWANSILIYFQYFGLLIFCSFIFYSILMMIFYSTDRRGIFYLYELTGSGVLTSLGICLLLSVVSTAIPFFSARRRSLTGIYKER